MIWKLFNKGDKIEEFWEWFLKNEEGYYNFEESQYESLFKRMEKKLRSIDENLAYEFGVSLKNGKREFIISAGGIESSFGTVLTMVEKAPLMDRWEIIPFRQRSNDEVNIKMNDIEIGTDDFYFTYSKTESEEKIDIMLFIKGFDENVDDWYEITFLMLDSVIGEYDVVTHIGHIDFEKYSEDLKENLLPLKELTNIVDELKTLN